MKTSRTGEVTGASAWVNQLGAIEIACGVDIATTVENRDVSGFVVTTAPQFFAQTKSPAASSLGIKMSSSSTRTGEVTGANVWVEISSTLEFTR